MFKRRRAQSRMDRVRSVVWPDRGFGRLFQYIITRIKRMPGSTTSIAVGAAWGIGVSFTPFIGLHLFVGLLLAYLTRGNLLACLFGTFVGNPWTFPFFFYLDYRLGAFILTEFGFQVATVGDTLGEFGSAFLASPTELVSALFLPLITGCLVLGTIGWFAGFGVTYWAVAGWRSHRSRRLEAARIRRLEMLSRNDNNADGSDDPERSDSPSTETQDGAFMKPPHASDEGR